MPFHQRRSFMEVRNCFGSALTLTSYLIENIDGKTLVLLQKHWFFCKNIGSVIKTLYPE
jgi:hypothetical protein